MAPNLHVRQVEVGKDMVIGLPLASVMGFRPDGARPSTDPPQDTTFSEQLRSTITESASRASSEGHPVQITVSERQDPGGPAGNRQYVITVDPTAAATPASTATGSSSPTTPASSSVAGTTAPVTLPPAVNNTDPLPLIPATNSGSVFQMENPIPKVKELLTKLGIDPSGIQFELLDDAVSNPLGSGHINHLLRVRTPNGRKEDYAVEYILRNPSITANEIVALNKLPSAPEWLRGI